MERGVTAVVRQTSFRHVLVYEQGVHFHRPDLARLIPSPRAVAAIMLAVDVALLAGRGLDDGVSFGDGAAAPHCPPMKAVLVADPTRAVPGVAFSRSSGVDHCSVLRADRGEETVDRPARRLQPAPLRRHGDPNVGMPEHA